MANEDQRRMRRNRQVAKNAGALAWAQSLIADDPEMAAMGAELRAMMLGDPSRQEAAASTLREFVARRPDGARNLRNMALSMRALRLAQAREVPILGDLVTRVCHELEGMGPETQGLARHLRAEGLRSRVEAILAVVASQPDLLEAFATLDLTALAPAPAS